MREMLRIKRSVQAMYNTQVNMMSAQMLNSAAIQVSGQTVDAMRLLDSKVAASAGKIFSFENCDYFFRAHGIAVITILNPNAFRWRGSSSTER